MHERSSRSKREIVGRWDETGARAARHRLNVGERTRPAVAAGRVP